MQHPRKLGKYPITGVLGQGAMGVVYRAHDPVIERTVAIKTIQRELVGDWEQADGMVARFRNEAKAVGRLAHPGIVAIYEYGEDGDTAFIAMEFVEGQNLESLLRQRGGEPLPEPELLSLMDQLLDALQAAHGQSVWHRDVKPANLLLTPTGQVKLTDFGIARIANMALTRIASSIGTPGYMAPEQYIGDDISHKVDLFAAGVLLYRLLTGQMPFAGTPEQVMYKVLNEVAVPPSQRAPGRCPPFYDALVMRALARQPEQRWASAAEFRDALTQRGVPLEPTLIAARAPAPDATVLMGRLSSSGSLAEVWTTAANASALAEVERALATVMGPIAKAIVRQEARRCGDLDSLCEAIAQHIPSEAERLQFVSGVGARSGATARRTQAPSTAPGSAAGGGSRGGVALTARPQEALSEACVAAAQPLLAQVVGVIARVIVKQAAAKANGKADFVERLVAAVEPADQAKVRNLLQRL